jgi:hypothetical protein
MNPESETWAGKLASNNTFPFKDQKWRCEFKNWVIFWAENGQSVSKCIFNDFLFIWRTFHCRRKYLIVVSTPTSFSCSTKENAVPVYNTFDMVVKYWELGLNFEF